MLHCQQLPKLSVAVEVQVTVGCLQVMMGCLVGCVAVGVVSDLYGRRLPLIACSAGTVLLAASQVTCCRSAALCSQYCATILPYCTVLHTLLYRSACPTVPCCNPTLLCCVPCRTVLRATVR